MNRRVAAARTISQLAAVAAVLFLPAQWLLTQPAPSQTSTAGLKSLSLEELGNVQVTTVSKQAEELWNTPAAVFVLSQDDIRRSGATSIPELLRLVPGVEVAQSQSGAWAVGIRGFASGFSKGLLVLVDGRSVYTPLFEGVYWDVQDLVLDDIDQIEVIRGTGGTIWGANAVNGVINIITKKAADTKGGFAHVYAGGPVTRFVGEVRYGTSLRPDLQLRIFAKGFNRGAEDNPKGDPYDDWHQARGGFRLDWQPRSSDAVTISSMAYVGKTGDQNTIGEFFPPSQLVVDGEQAVSGGDTLVRWDHTMSSRSGFYLQGYFDRTNRATSQFTETRNTIDIDFIDHFTALPRQEVTLGAGIRESPSHLVQTQATVNFAPNKINNYVYSLFAQDSFHIVPDRLTLTLGSKFVDDRYSGWGIQPSAEILWRPRSTTALWGSVARALRTPGRLDRDLSLLGNVAPSGPNGPIFLQVEGNPKFVPEVLIGWNAGLRELLLRRLYVDVAVFHNQHDNIESYGGPAPLFTFPTSPYPYEQINIQFGNGLRGVSDGLEIAPDWKLASWLDLRGAFSHVHVALHSRPGYGQAAYATSVEGSSPHREAFCQAMFTLPRGVEVDANYRFVSALPANNVPSYQTSDANIIDRIGRHFQISASGRNLLQPRHQESSGANSNEVNIKREAFGGINWLW
jgi:iron complex outermembrane recepter protein